MRLRKILTTVSALVLAAALMLLATGTLPVASSNTEQGSLSLRPAPAYADTQFASIADRILIWLIEKYASRDALQELIKRVGAQKAKEWLSGFFPKVDCGADPFCVLEGSPDITPPRTYVRYYIATVTATLRSGPGSNYASLGVIGKGTPVDVVCQARGTSYDGSTLWNRLTGGQWVHDALTTSPVYNNLSPPYRWC
jgi:uncharacterized protein YgiM (DUF1202 family)